MLNDVISPEFIPFPWAVKMMDIIKTVVPTAGICDVSSDDGFVVTVQHGREILDAFRSAKYTVWEPADSFWVVDDLDDHDMGITVDLTMDQYSPEDWAILKFFNEGM